MRNSSRGVLLLSALVIAGSCNSNPIGRSVESDPHVTTQPVSNNGSTQLDMLWVIDNSGSMCQEQETLAKNFKLFIDEIDETNLDFHIAVTTTHMAEDYSPEPIAKPGHIQSTPQPIPGFDASCIKTIDAQGDLIEGQFAPLKNSIAAAVKCMATPDESFNAFTTADFICATQGTTCEIAGRCGGAGNECTVEDLFPDETSYRAIPKVLRSEDYKAGNRLDVDRLKDDFACMSFVGTRGHGIERGLAATLEATKPELTGGPVDDDSAAGYDASAPNHGFLRKNARFALVFVTDENDCSSDGTIGASGSCGDAVCEYANIEGEEDNSPLIKVEDVRDQLFENLKLSKNRPDFGAGEILVASIHGEPRRFNGKRLAECPIGTETGVKPACANSLGVAYSGDRYQRFLQSFGEGQYFPRAEDATQGWLCAGDFSPALTAIGQFVGNIAGGCISQTIYPCERDTECPLFPYSNTPGACIDRPGSAEGIKYCDSGIQVRAELKSPTDANFEGLEATGYCESGSVGDLGFPNGCVISPEKYDFVACPAGLEGVKLLWLEEFEAREKLKETSIEVRFNSVGAER